MHPSRLRHVQPHPWRGERRRWLPVAGRGLQEQAVPEVQVTVDLFQAGSFRSHGSVDIEMQKIILRNEAKKLGKKRYYNGIPCPRGHLSERYVCSGGCIECNLLRDLTPRNREIKRLWARDHPRKRTNSNAQRFYGIKHRYGLSVTEYNEIIFRQNGKCPCCGIVLKSLLTKNIHVDHNHNTGKIRGILCGKCNLDVGYIEHPLFKLWLYYINSYNI